MENGTNEVVRDPISGTPKLAAPWPMPTIPGTLPGGGTTLPDGRYSTTTAPIPTLPFAL